MIPEEVRTMPFVFLPKRERVPSEVIFPVGAMVEGDREILLEIMEEIGHTVSKTGYEKFGITVDFAEI